SLWPSCRRIHFCLEWWCDHRDLLSFPTRRSSDLADGCQGVFAGFDQLATDGSGALAGHVEHCRVGSQGRLQPVVVARLVFTPAQDRKSTRLNSSHVKISYAVFCLKKKNNRI